MKPKSSMQSERERYLRSLRIHKIIIQTIRILIFVLFLISWECLSRFGIIDAFFFSSPSRIVRYLPKVNTNGTILVHTGITLYEIIISFLVTIVLSIGTAVLLWIFPTVSKIVEPYLVALNSLPKSALAPLLIVWLGTGSRTIIIAGISVALFGAIIQLYSCFMEADSKGMKLIATLGGNRFCCLRKVILPGSIPFVLSNMKVNIGLCLVGVVIGEFLSSRRGLGYLIIYSSQVFRLDLLILSIMILCLISILLYFVLSLLERVFTRSGRKRTK